MRMDYLVAYDVCDPKRLRAVHQRVDGFGIRVQYSIYLCPLTAKTLVLLLDSLSELINHQEDRVLVVRLGPSGRHTVEIQTLGQPMPDTPGKHIVL